MVKSRDHLLEWCPHKSNIYHVLSALCDVVSNKAISLSFPLNQSDFFFTNRQAAVIRRRLTKTPSFTGRSYARFASNSVLHGLYISRTVIFVWETRSVYTNVASLLDKDHWREWGFGWHKRRAMVISFFLPTMGFHTLIIKLRAGGRDSPFSSSWER